MMDERKRIKNTMHPKSPTQRKLRRQQEASERQARWDNMSNSERAQQKIAQGWGGSTEVEALLLRTEKERTYPDETTYDEDGFKR